MMAKGRRRTGLAMAAGLLSLVWAAPAAADDLGFEVRWGGLVPELQTSDGSFRIRPRFRVLFDGSETAGSNYAARNRSGTEVRSLLLGAEGAIGELTYAATADMAEHRVTLRNAYVGWRTRLEPAEVEVSLGNRLTERGLEGSSSSEGISFLERNVVANALSPLKGVYGMGLTVKAYGPDWHLAAQLAGDDVNNREVTRGTTTATARAHWNPLLTETATIHLGAWAYREDFTHKVARITRDSYWGDQHFNDDLRVSLGTVPAPRHANAYGIELGGTRGPGWAFGEYGVRRIATEAGPVTVEAWNAAAGWIVLGGRPGYSARSGTFVRQRPRQPVSRGGPGLVELATRYERLDNSDAPQGGTGRTATVGAAWWPEEWLRFTVNASCWRTHNRAGAFRGPDDGRTVSMRTQVAF